MESEGLKTMNSFCEQIFLQRDLLESLKDNLKVEQERLDKMEADLIKILEAANLKSFKAENGQVDIRQRLSIKTPQGEQKESFFNYLKELGLFEAMATINYNTLNSWYKEEQERAVQEGRYLDIPGLDIPTMTPILYVKRSK